MYPPSYSQFTLNQLEAFSKVGYEIALSKGFSGIVYKIQKSWGAFNGLPPHYLYGLQYKQCIGSSYNKLMIWDRSTRTFIVITNLIVLVYRIGLIGGKLQALYDLEVVELSNCHLRYKNYCEVWRSAIDECL